MPGLEREVERLSAQVATLEREKADLEAFAAVAAHELVEPLVMTEAYASIVSERLTGPEHAASRQDLAVLAHGAGRMRLLTESLLHEARTSERPLERGPVDMRALVTDCLALLQPMIACRRARVELHDLPEALGEEALLTSVVANLVVNALKYSPRTGAGIRVAGTREADACRYWVDSDGPPIRVEERERIFEAYRRGDGERRVGGSGLGLAICRRIVERHGGEIGVTPVNGSGNRFYFTLPLR